MHLATILLGLLAMSQTPLRDTMPDTWAATDHLGRKLPSFEQVGPPRIDRTVAIFYFLWLGEHVTGGPYDITKILRQDPDAMSKPDSPLWGPLHAPHHWGESLFGYYLTDDRYVLRKHAQMLTDAGVDAVIFDVTNQFTYKRWYMALLEVFAEARASGARAPKVAFLAPFWQPEKVVRELWRDLYKPGIHKDLWFHWEGKPLIMADPDLIHPGVGNTQQTHPERLEPGRTLGQTFRATEPFHFVAGSFPTWNTTDSAVTLTLYRGGPGGERIASKRFTKVVDNSWLALELEPPAPAGDYYLEASEAAGTIGWWSHSGDPIKEGSAVADGQAASGDRTLRVGVDDEEIRAIKSFFTFRKPQPDYFRGPTRPDMWSWLEVYPQHVFYNSKGEKEQMSVGVAQNAVSGRLGSMSEPGAHGRTWHQGRRDTSPGAIDRGLNFAEQARRALQEDPRLVFITGWNEWIAGRFAEFSGVKLPVMFVDQFNQEFSRDIEPMKGGHGDAYYYQMVDFIRRYKGVRPRPAASAPKTIRIDGSFADWRDVLPEYLDDAMDEARRDHPGWNNYQQLRNQTGRNDLLAMKVARDAANLYFYVRTREPITAPAGRHWMMLFLNTDGNGRNGWEGYDYVLNRIAPTRGQSVLEKSQGGWNWKVAARVRYALRGNEMEIAIPRKALGLPAAGAIRLEFKWMDNMQTPGDIMEFYLNGDCAPGGRFNYVYEAK